MATNSYTGTIMLATCKNMVTDVVEGRQDCSVEPGRNATATWMAVIPGGALVSTVWMVTGRALPRGRWGHCACPERRPVCDRCVIGGGTQMTAWEP